MELRRTRPSRVERCLAMSFSSTTNAWPFLLGVEDGTVPLGRELSSELGFNGAWLVLSTFIVPSSFLLSEGKESREADRMRITSVVVNTEQAIAELEIERDFLRERERGQRENYGT